MMDNNIKVDIPQNTRFPTLPAWVNKVPNALSSQKSTYDQYASIKKGIWIYFFLLLFEGALRKWVLPGLSSPLLIIRDPIAIWILVLANKKGVFKLNNYILGFYAISIIAIFTALLMGHGNFLVAIYGARIFLIHFPLIFVIGAVFSYEDVLKIGNVLLYISIPMTVLIAAQFYSPQSAWVNRGIGGDTEGGGFEGANGFFRPPATFSFITGTIGFYGMVTSYIFFYWFNTKLIKKIVLIAASVCLFAAVPLTISRSVFFDVVISTVFALFIVSRKPQFFKRLFPILIFAVIAFIALSQLDMFKTATDTFTMRFDNANEQEGGLQSVFLDRFLGGMIESLSSSADIPFFGFGIGMGTNVGSMLLSGRVSFLIAEAEWGRMIGEMGAILGLSAIFLRIGLSFKMMKASYLKMVRGDTLPWMLLSFALLNVAQGQWSQPTILGFSVMAGGLVLAALKGNPEQIRN